MGATYELTAAVREKVGKGAARATRREGLVPAVIYGGKQPSLAISLPDREITLKICGGGFFTTLATIVVGEVAGFDVVDDRGLIDAVASANLTEGVSP